MSPRSVSSLRASKDAQGAPAHPASRPLSGSAVILVAASLWGTTGTVRTFVPEATNVSIAAVRIVMGGMLLVLFASLAGRGAGLRRLLRSGRGLALVAVGGVAVTAYQTAFFTAAARTGVAIGTVVTIGSAPAFAGALGLILGRSAIDVRWALATSGAVAGCAALILGGEDAGAEPAGIGLALLSGLSYAVYATLASGLIDRGEQDRAVAGAMFGVAAVLLLPVLLAGDPGWAFSGRGTLIAVYLGVITTACAYVLFARGLRTTPATTATTLTLAEPAIAAVLGMAVLDERLGVTALAGLALLAASLLVLVRPARR
ncbi:EamA family transporter [Actinomadura sp. SCN-SB]|uniref:EamA family transporter n=1 Tax=Actinomadura sp. SCN-SB TaxID=3373092 RepID=UPI003750E53C